MRAVNLLPREMRPKRSFEGSGAVIVGGVAAAAIVVLALGAGFMTAHARAASEAQKLADAKSELRLVQRDSLQRQLKIAARVGARRTIPIVPVPPVTAEEQPRLTALASALAGRVQWDRVLREFSQVMPSDITVSSLTLNAPAAGASAQAGGFSLQGLAFSHDSVARLLERLMLIPDLTDVSLSSSTADPASGKVTFQIQAAVKGAAPSGGTS